MKINTLVSLLILSCFFVSCNIHKKTNVSDSSPDLLKFSNEIIINNLLKIDSVNNTRNRQTVLFVDSLLIYRPVLLPKFPFPEKYDMLLDSYPDYQYVLHLPDSVKSICNYWTKNMDATLKDTVEIAYYSPLLPTRQQGVYAMQVYIFVSDPFTKSRLAFMNINLFQISLNRIKRLNPLILGTNMTAWEN